MIYVCHPSHHIRRVNVIEDSMWFGPHSEKKFRVKIVEAQNLVADRLFGIGVKACPFEICEQSILSNVATLL